MRSADGSSAGQPIPRNIGPSEVLAASFARASARVGAELGLAAGQGAVTTSVCNPLGPGQNNRLDLRRVRRVTEVREQRRQVLGRVQHPQDGRWAGRRIVHQVAADSAGSTRTGRARKAARDDDGRAAGALRSSRPQSELLSGAVRPLLPLHRDQESSRLCDRDPRPPVAKNSESGSCRRIGSPRDRCTNPLCHLIASQVAIRLDSSLAANPDREARRGPVPGAAAGLTPAATTWETSR